MEHELVVEIIKATGENIVLYQGDFVPSEYIPVVLPKIDLNDPDSIEQFRLIMEECNGNTIRYSYNNSTVKARITEFSNFLQNNKYNLQYSSIEGVVDNNLAIAGNHKTTDLSTKVDKMIPNAERVIKDGLLAKINTVIKTIAEINITLKKHKPSNTKLGYRMGHHFPSPEEYKTKKSNN